ncbi:hypothetical protein CK203_074936 [Vitis vinifera]|uniref:VWFA domain-containing protein n=1 Tax=Vitis vinifera TaxID=29760 RepID=A0A438E8X8_VITVI|nr:hypothetical protein CK203_074936 [Vitis vinifera]
MGSRSCDCRLAVPMGEQLTLIVPFHFPEYVTPAGKKVSKKEKIQLNVNCGTGMEVLCKTTSHPLKVPSSHIHGSVLLQSPSVHDVDQREMFCLYLFPGNQQTGKVFRKEVVFVVDISGSMRGKLLEDTKNALSAALSKLDSKDSFSIIAFNGEIFIFHRGDTNILLPMNKAMELFSHSPGSIPIIFLITDGSVEDERHICDVMTSYLTNEESIHPRIYTFGIDQARFHLFLKFHLHVHTRNYSHRIGVYCYMLQGLYCNHYFLKMLAMIGRGHYDAAYDANSIELRVERLFTRASSTVLANITIDDLEDLDDFEVYPSHMPDLSSESVWTVSGRYKGNFPDTIQARGIFADLNNFVTDLKVQKAKEIPLDRVLAKQQIGWLTAQAWFSENKQLEEKIAEMSIQTGVISEYTRMILLETQGGAQVSEPGRVQEPPKTMEYQRPVVDSKVQKIILLQSLGVGFGNVNATAENYPPGSEEVKLPEAAEIFVKAASNCCAKMCGYCCCMCCIRMCTRMNDQCAIVLTQLCSASPFWAASAVQSYVVLDKREDRDYYRGNTQIYCFHLWFKPATTSFWNTQIFATMSLLVIQR